jgi:hypothetical protein
MQENITKCYGFGTEGAGISMMVQHKAERGPDVVGWDCTLVLDCTREQHDLLQQLIKRDLAKGRAKRRPELGEGILLENMPDWDLGAYMSTLCNKLVDDGTGEMVRACVKGGKIGGKIDPSDTRKVRSAHACMRVMRHPPTLVLLAHCSLCPPLCTALSPLHAAGDGLA